MQRGAASRPSSLARSNRVLDRDEGRVLEVVIVFAGWNISAIAGPREGRLGIEGSAVVTQDRAESDSTVDDSDQKPKTIGCLAPGLFRKGCEPTRHVRSSSAFPNPGRGRCAEPAGHQKPSRWSSEASVSGRKSVPDVSCGVRGSR